MEIQQKKGGNSCKIHKNDQRHSRNSSCIWPAYLNPARVPPRPDADEEANYHQAQLYA